MANGRKINIANNFTFSDAKDFIIFIFNELRYRIITTSAPRIARNNAFDCQPRTFEGAIFFQCFYSIYRTSGNIATTPSDKRGQCPLVYFYKKNKNISQTLAKIIEKTLHFKLSTIHKRLSTSIILFSMKIYGSNSFPINVMKISART